MRTPIIAATLIALATSGVWADSLPTLIPATVGERVHLRITRTLQGLDAPQTATADVLVQRKTGDSYLIERRDQSGALVDSVLSLGSNGTLQLAASERNLSSDADLRALLPVLNAALAVTQAASPPVWSASLTVPVGQENASTTMVIPLQATNPGSDFDVHGSASTAVESEENGGQQQGERRRTSFGGSPGGGFGGPGGGFGGGLGSMLGGAFGGRGTGGGSHGQSGDSSPSPGSGPPQNAMAVLIRIDGHVSGGRMHHLTIAQTREIQVGGAPYVNVSSWTIDVVN